MPPVLEFVMCADRRHQKSAELPIFIGDGLGLGMECAQPHFHGFPFLFLL